MSIFSWDGIFIKKTFQNIQAMNRYADQADFSHPDILYLPFCSEIEHCPIAKSVQLNRVKFLQLSGMLR